jgi:hypothetical protein
MRFPAVHPFVGAAERAHAAFDFPHQPEGSAGLFFAGAAASGAVPADFRQRPIKLGNGGVTHEPQAWVSSAAWAGILQIASEATSAPAAAVAPRKCRRFMFIASSGPGWVLTGLVSHTLALAEAVDKPFCGGLRRFGCNFFRSIRREPDHFFLTRMGPKPVNIEHSTLNAEHRTSNNP